MKRLIAISVFIVLFSGAAFAQLADGITLYSWGSGAFVPLRIVSDTMINGKPAKNTGFSGAGAGITWGGMRPGIVFRIDGSYQYAGFSMSFEAMPLYDIYKKGDSVATGDVGAHFWVRPFGNDWVKLTLGKFVDDTLRGKFGLINGGFEYFTVYGNVKEEDQIFSRFSTHNDITKSKNHVSNVFADVGFMLSSSPIKNLFIGVLVDGSMYADDWGGPTSGVRAADMYRYIQAGVGYKIGAANIRAQYIGGFLGTYDQKRLNALLNSSGDVDLMDIDLYMLSKPARIEAAVSFSGVPNLFFDLGFKAWMPLEFKENVQGIDENKYSRGFDVSMAASYRASAFNIAARVDVTHLASYMVGDEWMGYEGRPTSGSNNKASDSPVIDVRLVPTYSFGGMQIFGLDLSSSALTVGLDLGYRVTLESKDAAGTGNKDAKTELGFGAFIKQSFANGSIKAGVTYSLAPLNNEGKLHGQNIIQIPLILEYNFF